MTGAEGRRVAVVWFRRDLRLHDHPALAAAAASADAVVPLFVLDERLLDGRARSSVRIAFMLAAVRSLGEDLAARGAPLVVARGDPRRIVPAVAARAGAETVHVTREVGPYGAARDAAVAAALAADGRTLTAWPGLAVHEPGTIRTDDGRPYTVHGPFARRWTAALSRPIVTAPARIAGPSAQALARISADAAAIAGGSSAVGEAAGRLLAGTERQVMAQGDAGAGDAGARAAAAEVGLAASEAAARARLDRWVAEGLAGYATRRDLLGTDGTSRLSQDLRWGLLSAVEVRSRAEAAAAGEGGRAFVAELSWRDFYLHALAAFPSLASGPYRPAADAIPWRDDPAGLEAWRAGRTGFPVVDAAMRQLAATGWMHNRARMIVASFLVKDLLVDWRAGERHFMRLLVDGDLASNGGGWQWVAGCGPDAQPWFRILDPVAQGRRHDPDGAYVRRWVPELAALPARWIHAPWTAPDADLRASGVRLGRDYPAPIVDRRMTRERALAAYAAVRAARATAG
jgi:deoxyribodipyrimidine photo-lyase